MHPGRLSRRNIIFIMISLMISLLLAALDNTIAGTAMPRIIRDLKGMEHYSRPFTAYTLFSTAGIILFGKLSDIFGRKSIFLFGIVFFMGSLLHCGISGNAVREIGVKRTMPGTDTMKLSSS